MGQGEGEGHGAGEGAGLDSAENVGIGCGVIAVVIILFCVFGVPMLIAGAVMMAISPIGGGYIYDVGLALLIIACLLTAAGILVGLLVCTGVCGTTTRRTGPVTQAIVVSSTQTQMASNPQYAQAPPYYNQGGAYPGPPGQPNPGQQYPGQQQYAGPQYSGQQQPGQQYPGPQQPGQQQPGELYPGPQQPGQQQDLAYPPTYPPPAYPPVPQAPQPIDT